MTNLWKMTLTNGNSAQTLLYFFLLMLYKVSPCKICWLCGVAFILFFFYSFKIYLCFFLLSNCKSRAVVVVYGSWIYNYPCNQCLSPLTLWVRIPLRRDVQHYVIKFVSDLWQVDGFLWALGFPPPIKLSHDITEILLNVTFNIIILTLTPKL